MDRVSPLIDSNELRRVCGILEGIADRCELSAEEEQAVETVLLALMAANLSTLMQSSYRKLAEAHNGNIPDSLSQDLREHGLDLEELESELGENEAKDDPLP